MKDEPTYIRLKEHVDTELLYPVNICIVRNNCPTPFTLFCK